MDTVGWFPSYDKCGLISTLWKVLVDFHLMISSVRFPSVGWFPYCGKCGLIVILREVRVDFYLMTSEGWFSSYEKFGLIFILWQVLAAFHVMESVGWFSFYEKFGLMKFFIKEGGKCGSVGKRLEKFPPISQLASPRSLDDDLSCFTWFTFFLLPLSSTFCHAEQTGVSEQIPEMLNKGKTFPYRRMLLFRLDSFEENS